ncbi:MAG: hypothetical protein RSE58_05605 [Clostridia bacterium]
MEEKGRLVRLLLRGFTTKKEARILKKWFVLVFSALLSIGFMQTTLAQNNDFLLSASGELVPKLYIESIARLTLQCGDYEDWSLDEKKEMLLLMEQHQIASPMTTNQVLMVNENEIDAFILERYGVPSLPNDLSVISLTRIAWVELGSYSEWPNETWVWYSHMMLDLGLWNENNDVDIYQTPGDEAITPEQAVSLAQKHLLAEGAFDEELVNQAHAVWHYMTHASDTQKEYLKYYITFYFNDGSIFYVTVTPQGKIE